MDVPRILWTQITCHGSSCIYVLQLALRFRKGVISCETRSTEPLDSPFDVIFLGLDGAAAGLARGGFPAGGINTRI
jgi:hypothetical protein